MTSILEIACFNTESCMIAQEAGAHRIEFCADYESGGITPSHQDIAEVRKLIHIPLFVMIRPRKGNYVYTKAETELMKNDILFCKLQKIDGVVFGALNEANKIDEHLCKELLALASPMKCTFHRAFDLTSNLDESLEKLIGLGFDAVLTSGGQLNALAGKDKLKHLQKKYGHKICILPGGGIRPTNIEQIKSETACTNFHSAAMNLNSKTIDATILRELLLTINS